MYLFIKVKGWGQSLRTKGWTTGEQCKQSDWGTEGVSDGGGMCGWNLYFETV